MMLGKRQQGEIVGRQGG